MTDRVFARLQDIPRHPHVVVIGTFDGVHRGHRHLLGLAAERARALGLPVLVITFEPSPSQVLRPEKFTGRLVTPSRKLELLSRLDVDEILVLAFTREFASIDAQTFMEQLANAATPSELWVGEDFALGRGREGTIERLVALGEQLGYWMLVVPRIDLDGQEVSSSAIRRHIQQGDVRQATRLLGHRYRIQGEVVHGAHIGRTIGYPTANVVPPDDLVALPDGIYVTMAELPGWDSGLLPAMTYIGTRPALNTGSRLIETHLLDFDGDIYGEQLATEFVERLRPDANFASVELLIAQLQDDERRTRQVLAEEVETDELTSEGQNAIDAPGRIR